MIESGSQIVIWKISIQGSPSGKETSPKENCHERQQHYVFDVTPTPVLNSHKFDEIIAPPDEMQALALILLLGAPKERSSPVLGMSLSAHQAAKPNFHSFNAQGSWGNRLTGSPALRVGRENALSLRHTVRDTLAEALRNHYSKPMARWCVCYCEETISPRYAQTGA